MRVEQCPLCQLHVIEEWWAWVSLFMYHMQIGWCSNFWGRRLRQQCVSDLELEATVLHTMRWRQDCSNGLKSDDRRAAADRYLAKQFIWGQSHTFQIHLVEHSTKLFNI